MEPVFRAPPWPILGRLLVGSCKVWYAESPMFASSRPLAVLLLLTGGGATASMPTSGLPSLDRPTRLVLDNGMRVIIREHRASDVVALHLWVGVGGRDERPAELGFSHLVEHMLFKGTETRGPGFIDREVEAVGGRTNAGTSLDYTFYYILLPARQALRAIEVMADVAVNSAFDPKELERGLSSPSRTSSNTT